MNHIYQKLALLAGQVKPQYIKLFFLILTLCMLVIGAGAPTGGGDGSPYYR